MRKSVGLVVLVCCVLGVAAVASAGDDGGDLVVTEEIVKFTQLDLGEAGLSQGDRWVYRSDVLDEAGKLVGTGGGECVVVVPKPEFGVTNCLGYMNLAGGQLTFSGLFDFNEGSGIVAITGGTADYAGARGTLSFKQIDGDTFRDEIRLIG